MNLRPTNLRLGLTNREPSQPGLASIIGSLVLCALFVFTQIQLLEHTHAHNSELESDTSCVMCGSTDAPSIGDSEQLEPLTFVQLGPDQLQPANAGQHNSLSYSYLSRAPPIS
jgi:hypothetical protein